MRLLIPENPPHPPPVKSAGPGVRPAGGLSFIVSQRTFLTSLGVIPCPWGRSAGVSSALCSSLSCQPATSDRVAQPLPGPLVLEQGMGIIGPCGQGHRPGNKYFFVDLCTRHCWTLGISSV